MPENMFQVLKGYFWFVDCEVNILSIFQYI